MGYYMDPDHLPRPFLSFLWRFIAGQWRFTILPKFLPLTIYVHYWVQGDSRTLGLHDHPRPSGSIRLWGEMCEDVFVEPIKTKALKYVEKAMIEQCSPDAHILLTRSPIYWETKRIPIPFFRYRPADYAHSVVLQSRTACTIFFFWGRRQPWGFYTPFGWVRNHVVSEFYRKALDERPDVEWIAW